MRSRIVKEFIFYHGGTKGTERERGACEGENGRNETRCRVKPDLLTHIESGIMNGGWSGAAHGQE